MAELLIKAENSVLLDQNGDVDTNRDRIGSYKIGMPVVVQPDGHMWGAGETLPKFVVLKLPGVSVDQVRRFIEPDVVEDGTQVVDGQTVPKFTIYRRRLWRIFVEDLPLAVRNKWISQGYLEVGPTGDYTWSQVRTFIKNLRTNEAAPEAL